MDPLPLRSLSASTHQTFRVSVVQPEQELMDYVTPNVAALPQDVSRSSQISRLQIKRSHDLLK